MDMYENLNLISFLLASSIINAKDTECQDGGNAAQNAANKAKPGKEGTIF